MKEVTLRAMQCQESGEVGLTIVGTPAQDSFFVAQEGNLIAHDLVEHVDHRQIGGAAEELMAMGAAWYVRGRHGDVVRSPNVNCAEQHIAADVGHQCFEAWLFKQDRYWDETVPYECTRDIDAALPYIFKYALENMKEVDREYRKFGDEFKFFMGAKQFMRKGYDLARERYHDTRGCGNTLFWNIAEAVDGFLKYNELWEGMEATLMYSVEEGMATVCDVEEDEYV